jgi:peptidoglycan/xylan/chitin deacetylase (PgdA/CDA1 family)
VNALMYHDLVAVGDEDSSGFPGRDAALYKITPRMFDAHLNAISCSLAGDTAVPAPPALPALTFDDGGRSAMVAADMLEARGWRGHFFITTNYIGTYAFLTRNEIQELASRGHTIGAHSCSHPLRMAHCTWQQLVEEWSRSCSTLSEITGAPVTEASVPGGDFAPQVADAAARAGIARLFTSEPTAHIRQLCGTTVAGRFTIQRWSSPATAAAIAAGDWLPCARQALAWNAKKMTKRLGGARYLRIRRLLLGHANDVRWGDLDG